MTVKGLISTFTQQEDINFLLTNRIPRAAVTRFMGWFSKIENPLVRNLSIACWRLFSDLDLSEARKTEFRSLHDCFTRELMPGSRPFDPDPAIVASPSDGIVGAFGEIADTELFQVKGAPYSLFDLLGDPQLVEQHRNGRFITLRLTSSMYHRFHAPHDATMERVTYVSGDTWNVNPIALKRVERLFCRNERAVLRLRLASGGPSGGPGAGGGDPGPSIRLHHPRRRDEHELSRRSRHRVLDARATGRRARLVRAWVHDHRLRPARLPPVRRHRRRHEDPDGPAPNGSALTRPGSGRRTLPFHCNSCVAVS